MRWPLAVAFLIACAARAAANDAPGFVVSTPGPVSAAPPQPSVLAVPAAVPEVVAHAPLGDGFSCAPHLIGGLLTGPGAFLQNLNPVTARVPLVTRGPVRIGENESARPQDRFYFSYNHFNHVRGYDLGVPEGPNRASAPRFDLHRETFGFEKTFLDGRASFGVRVPVIQKDGLGAYDLDGLADITAIIKYAFYLDAAKGDAVSGGVAVTAPTGRKVILADDEHLDSVLLQPWAGFVLNSDRFFVQGFASVVVPTDKRDAAYLTGDLGVGYKLVTGPCDGIITQVAPVLELHANVPLNHAGVDSGGLVVFPSQFTATAGVHLGLGSFSTLSFAGAVPLSGPRATDFEILCQLQVRF